MVDFRRSARVTVRVEPVADSAVIVHVTGEIDLATGGPLREALTVAAEDATYLVCDLSGVTFLGCHGLASLLEAKSTVDARGGELRVVATEPVVLRLFEITGLTEAFGLRAGALYPV